MDSPNPASVAPTVPTYRPTLGRRCVSAETLRAAQPNEDWAGDVAPLWQTLSGHPRERGTAINRFRSLQGRLDPAVLFLALGEWACGKDASGESYHAHGFTELVARERIGRIRETLREIEKAEYKAEAAPAGAIPPRRGMRSLGAILAGTR